MTAITTAPFLGNIGHSFQGRWKATRVLCPPWMLALTLAGAPEAEARSFGAPPPERGVALGLFSQDPAFDYHHLLEEIRALGATHVTVTWVWWQDTIRAHDIRRVESWSATDEQIVTSIRAAKTLGLHVTALPIIRLVNSAKNEWRGRIAPESEDEWWRSYRAFVLHSAKLSRQGGADRFSVGSELLSREHMRDRWTDVIESLRVETPELELMYSANWDHYEKVTFWDLVDVVAITGYWELTRSLDPTVEELNMAWVGVKRDVEAWSRRLGRPIVVSEIGYPSLDGAAAWPWDETRKSAVDLEEQRRAYEAFARSWSDTPFLRGAYWWNWFGFGGARDTNYTPRRKPAEDVIRAWYRSACMTGTPVNRSDKE